MTPFERIELAARRVAMRYGANGTHESNLISEAFTAFADEIIEQGLSQTLKKEDRRHTND